MSVVRETACGRAQIIRASRPSKTGRAQFDVLLDGRPTHDGSGLTREQAESTFDWVVSVLGLAP